MSRYKIRTYTATVTVTVYEDMESSWHAPFTEDAAKALARECVYDRASVEAGGYGARVVRVTMRKHDQVVYSPTRQATKAIRITNTSGGHA